MIIRASCAALGGKTTSYLHLEMQSVELLQVLKQNVFPTIKAAIMNILVSIFYRVPTTYPKLNSSNFQVQIVFSSFSCIFVLFHMLKRTRPYLISLSH